MSLNVLCTICSEYFCNTDIIFSTSKCGHVFHRQCLFRWLSRSNSCPQCRANVHKHNVHRLFLDFNERNGVDEVQSKPTQAFEWIYVDESVDISKLSEFGCDMGLDEEGNSVFAARVYLEDDLLPCYYLPKVKGVYAAWNCKSHFLVDDIELLYIKNDDAAYEWITSCNGEIPPNALKTGYNETGETLYTARALYNDRLRYGKLHPSHGCAYVPYMDKEANNKNYEVLVRIQKHKE